MENRGSTEKERNWFSSKEVEHKNVLVRNATISNKIEGCTKESFIRYMQTLNRKVPKHMITLDEKYIRYCLELVYANAMRGTFCTHGYDSGDLEKHHSFRQSVDSENGIVDERANLVDVTRSAIDTAYTSSRLSIGSSFTFIDKTNQGMLHCSLKAGLPRYVFSFDDRNEVFIAKMIKPEPSDNKGFDYLYTFYSNKAHLVGKMRVSTSFKLCRNHSEIKETKFVLFGEEERDKKEVQTSTSTNVKKSRGLWKKMTEVFKTSYTSREKTAYKYDSTYTDLFTEFSTNLELASVIVKDHVCETPREPEVAGWGMKFLKKIESKTANASIGTLPSPCEYFVENNSDCSTSTNIIIPTGLHGHPINRTGGPTSLVERWRKGGKCDCGGWDIGCPITVLDTKQSKNENVSQVDIRVSGKRDSTPVMKMVSIRDGLYVVNFEPILSPLQSFAMAVSMIHSQTAK